MFINTSTINQAAYVATITEILGFTPEESLVIYSPTTPRAVAVIPLHDLVTPGTRQSNRSPRMGSSPEASRAYPD